MQALQVIRRGMAIASREGMRSLAYLAATSALLAGCSTGTAAGADSMTAAAVGAAAVSRAKGGCIALCNPGTMCNPNTGLCETDPCGGRCDASEACEGTFTGARCVRSLAGVSTRADGGAKTLPIAPVLEAPEENRASPTIVPTAEKQR